MHIRRLARSATVVAVEVGALIALLAVPAPAIDWGDLAGWLDRVAPEDAVVALVRIVAIGTATYSLASTGLYLLAHASRIPALVHGAATLTLPGIRRLVDGAVVAAFVAAPSAAVFAAPAGATEVPAGVQLYTPVPAGDVVTVGYEPRPAGDAIGTTYVVQRGDSLWSIAEAHLAELRGTPAASLDVSELSRYWRLVVDLNAPTLASGHPDVIFPGETVVLPAA